MRAYKSRAFAQFCRKNRIPDDDLCAVLNAMLLGAIDADLGGGVYKQRLRRQGQGKSGSYRTIILLRLNHLALFAYGFAKNERDNIERYELMEFRQLAKEVFQYGEKEIDTLVQSGAIQQLHCEN